MTEQIRTKRIYDSASQSDGCRILVDRVWPRGLRKADARLDHWLKDIAPSTELRKWFGHDPDRYAEFRRRYQAELDDNEALAELEKLAAQHATLTLLYAAKDTQHNHAVVLADYLRQRLK